MTFALLTSEPLCKTETAGTLSANDNAGVGRGDVVPAFTAGVDLADAVLPEIAIPAAAVVMRLTPFGEAVAEVSVSEEGILIPGCGAEPCNAVCGVTPPSAGVFQAVEFPVESALEKFSGNCGTCATT